MRKQDNQHSGQRQQKSSSDCSKSSRRDSRAGFTLIEILVAVAIIAILVGVVSVNLLHQPSEARVTAAKTQIRTFKTAIQMYKTDNGFIPTMEQGLEALVQKPFSQPVPESYPVDGYLDSRRLPLDPWKREYVYLVPGRQGESYEIISYGSDGEPDGVEYDADISSSEI